jgi:hypothetical protein
MYPHKEPHCSPNHNAESNGCPILVRVFCGQGGDFDFYNAAIEHLHDRPMLSY